VIIVSKYRKKRLYGKFRQAIGDTLKQLCRQKPVELVEKHLQSDHIHMYLSVPPKFRIAFIIGFLKGKNAIRIHREILKVKRIRGLHFWSRGYCVSTVGLDEEKIRKYIRDQEKME
jgi:putative transposase